MLISGWPDALCCSKPCSCDILLQLPGLFQKSTPVGLSFSIGPPDWYWLSDLGVCQSSWTEDKVRALEQWGASAEAMGSSGPCDSMGQILPHLCSDYSAASCVKHPRTKYQEILISQSPAFGNAHSLQKLHPTLHTTNTALGVAAPISSRVFEIFAQPSQQKDCGVLLTEDLKCMQWITWPLDLQLYLKLCRREEIPCPHTHITVVPPPIDHWCPLRIPQWRQRTANTKEIPF